ncbi:cation:proton antiporter [Mycolicibacterium goodii]|uniref:cation:proton antiporter n=1 Tax=Mycolicibacterium goodii TaxID=134601 RepID=UPI001BDC893A|nr:cation:proton antiporter [Mycolicibacterium goodii]MBU8813009.1 cation:proton antiporter [Mycolicibacterium goodii]
MVAIVSVVALLAPLSVKVLRLPVPAIVLEILLGVIVGPQVLGWVHMDAALQVLSTIGLSFLLLLAGLEIDVRRLRGPVLRRASGAFVVSFALAVAVGVGLGMLGLVQSPVLMAVILSATGLGIILPVLKDAGIVETRAGQVIVAGASIAEIVPIILLSLLFSEDTSAGVGAKLTLLAAFLGFTAAVIVVVLGLERAHTVCKTLLDLQDTTAEIRVRGTVALLLVFASLATAFGLESILGAFLAGAALTLLDRDDDMTHTQFYTKLHAVGFGVFIPFFFVATGVSLDVRALVDQVSSLAKIPVFLVALLVVRALPAVFYRPLLGHRRDVVAVGLLQATSLSIPVVAGGIGVELGLMQPANYAALVAAGLLSVIVFPRLAVLLLARGATESATSDVRAKDGLDVAVDPRYESDDRPRSSP